MLVQEIMKFRILVKLLTQQSAARSTTREEIEEDPFVLAFGLGHGLVERALEPVLSRGKRGDKENDRKEGERFLHRDLTPINYKGDYAGCQQDIAAMTFIMATPGRRAIGIFHIPLWKRGARGDLIRRKKQNGYGVA